MAEKFDLDIQHGGMYLMTIDREYTASCLFCVPGNIIWRTRPPLVRGPHFGKQWYIVSLLQHKEELMCTENEMQNSDGQFDRVLVGPDAVRCATATHPFCDIIPSAP